MFFVVWIRAVHRRFLLAFCLELDSRSTRWNDVYDTGRHSGKIGRNCFLGGWSAGGALWEDAFGRKVRRLRVITHRPPHVAASFEMGFMRLMSIPVHYLTYLLLRPTFRVYPS